MNITAATAASHRGSQVLGSRTKSPKIANGSNAAPGQAVDFFIQTDASGYATGAVLMQDQGKGAQPIAFLSKKMNAAEMNYSTRDQEFLAIKHAVTAWSHYLQGRHFTIYTDHESLQFLRTAELQTRRHQRWEILMADFDFTIKYIKGANNHVADALSRGATLAAVGGYGRGELDRKSVV